MAYDAQSIAASEGLVAEFLIMSKSHREHLEHVVDKTAELPLGGLAHQGGARRGTKDRDEICFLNLFDVGFCSVAHAISWWFAEISIAESATGLANIAAEGKRIALCAGRADVQQRRSMHTTPK